MAEEKSSISYLAKETMVSETPAQQIGKRDAKRKKNPFVLILIWRGKESSESPWEEAWRMHYRGTSH